MKATKNKNISGVLILILILILIGICVLLGYMGVSGQKMNLDLKDEYEKLEDENAAYKEENQELLDQITQLSDKVKELEDTLEGIESRLDISELEPGTIVELTEVESYLDDMFQPYEIVEGDAVYNRINGKSYRENNNIGLDDLRYLKVLHYNFEHQIQVGEIIVNAAISDKVINVFKELFDAEYEVESMYLIDNYWTGDGATSDSASIDVNNTSAFCYRQVTGGGNLSNHAYGCAIDINPQQNPYVWYSGGQKQWSHDNASAFIDRDSGDPHVIVRGDVCFSIFEKYGFEWGGDWSDPIDYQHFEIDYDTL